LERPRIGPRRIRSQSDPTQTHKPTAHARKACKCRPFRERLKGFEPSTCLLAPLRPRRLGNLRRLRKRADAVGGARGGGHGPRACRTRAADTLVLGGVTSGRGVSRRALAYAWSWTTADDFSRMAARRQAGIRASQPGAVRRPLGLADDLVGEEGEAVADGPGVEEAHAVLVAGLLEEAFAGPQGDRVNHQP